MKRKALKITSIVLAFILGVTLLSSSAFATSVPTDMMYSNKPGVTEENAEVVMSYMLDNTTPQPGDVITLTVSVDKLPSDGGLCALSNRIGYDNTKLEPIMCNRKEEVGVGDDYKFVYVIPGEAGQKLRIGLGSANILKESFTGSTTINAISLGGYTYADSAILMEGMIYQLQFKVKDNVTLGKTDLFILAEEAPWGGFDLSTTYYDSDWNAHPQRPSSWYVETNMDELTIE